MAVQRLTETDLHGNQQKDLTLSLSLRSSQLDLRSSDHRSVMDGHSSSGLHFLAAGRCLHESANSLLNTQKKDPAGLSSIRMAHDSASYEQTKGMSDCCRALYRTPYYSVHMRCIPQSQAAERTANSKTPAWITCVLWEFSQRGKICSTSVCKSKEEHS